jgi:hypothetical protein
MFFYYLFDTSARHELLQINVEDFLNKFVVEKMNSI